MEPSLLLWLSALVSIAAAAALFISFNYRVTSSRRGRGKQDPPEAAGGWPLIGHLSLLSGPDLPHIALSNLADKHGPIFSIRLGSHRALVVSSSEVAKECFTSTNDVIFSNRPETAALRHMSYDFAMFGFSKYGAYWREMRKIATLNLLSNQRVKMLGDSFETEIRSLIVSLFKKSKEKGPVEMKKVFGDLTLRLMARVIAGNMDDGSSVEMEGNEKWREPINEFFRMMNVLTLPDVLPFLKWFNYFSGTNETFKRTGKEMDRMLQAWLENSKSEGVGEGGFMAEMVAVAERVAKEFHTYDADTINKAICQSMILGGTDTNTVTLTWALCALLNNPHALARAQEELDTQIGRERLVNHTDIEKLVYIQAIIKETMRLYPPAPLLPPRQASDDCTVAGYHVSSGTRLTVNLWKLHRDPKTWPNPLEFQPERFLTSHKDVDVQGQHFELLPFGGGRRICPGVSFALQMVALALANLLHGFDIGTHLGEPVDMTASFGSANVKATPLQVLLKPRLCLSLYE